jgi:hypothetical protein
VSRDAFWLPKGADEVSQSPDDDEWQSDPPGLTTGRWHISETAQACTCELCRKRALYATELAAARRKHEAPDVVISMFVDGELACTSDDWKSAYGKAPPLGPRQVFMACTNCGACGHHHPGRKLPWACPRGCDPAYYVKS